MRKILVYLLVIGTLLSLSSVCYAKANIGLVNLTGETVIYQVYWIDHDWDREICPGPGKVMVGELNPTEDITSSFAYKPGKYAVKYYEIDNFASAKVHYFKIFNSDVLVVITLTTFDCSIIESIPINR